MRINDTENKIKKPSVVQKVEKKSGMETKNNFSFQDVESAVSMFDGGKNKNSKMWVTLFEKVAETFEWNEVQKFIYCRSSLKSAAKLAAEAENVFTFKELKEFLLVEFKQGSSSKSVYQQLSTTKKEADETFFNYFYRIKKISSIIEIEESSCIEYIIAGINDTLANKSMLCTANTCADLKTLIIRKIKIRGNRQSVVTTPVEIMERIKILLKNKITIIFATTADQRIIKEQIAQTKRYVLNATGLDMKLKIVLMRKHLKTLIFFCEKLDQSELYNKMVLKWKH